MTSEQDRFIVMEKKACMPASCKYSKSYRKLAVVELDGTVDEPKMISTRARGVKRIVVIWPRLHKGAYDGMYWEALTEANALASKLNSATK